MSIKISNWEDGMRSTLEEFVDWKGYEDQEAEVPDCIHFGAVDSSQPLHLLMHPDDSDEFLEIMDELRRTAKQLILFLDVRGIEDFLERIKSEGVPPNLKGIVVTREFEPTLIHGGDYAELAETLRTHFPAYQYVLGGTELRLHDLEDHGDELLGCVKTLLRLGQHLAEVHVDPTLVAIIDEQANHYMGVMASLPEEVRNEFRRRINLLCPELRFL